MKDVIFGFGFELIGVTLYFIAWGWIASMLEGKFERLKDRVIFCSLIAAAILHVFVVNYYVLGFWLAMGIVIYEVWSDKVVTLIEDKAPWVNKFNLYAVRIILTVIAFILLRNIIFQSTPEKIWYY